MAAVLLVIAAVLSLGAAQAKWQRGPAMPVPRTEVTAAPFQGGIAVVGGFLADGRVTNRIDLYVPRTRKWRRLPNLPAAVNHASAASAGGKLYVVGGYGRRQGQMLRSAFVFDGKRWRSLTPMPAVRAAAGAAIARGKLYVVGGVTTEILARDAFVLDIAAGTWSTFDGPTPREHLAATTANGVIYALAGRLGGLDSNLDLFEAYSPDTGRWTSLPPVPYPRGGTGAAVARGLLVSVGGEEEGGTIGSVYGYDLAAGRWRKLPNLPTPRHGLGVAAIGTRIYAIGGGPSPGLTVSGANEALTLP
jgi:N-acetylneuraminic acid mutarotase